MLCETGHAKEVLHMHYALSMIFTHFLIQKSLNFKKLSGGKGGSCVRENSQPSNRPIGDGACKGGTSYV